MHIFDVLEAWLLSVGEIYNSTDVAVRFERSQTDRPNPSCSLNLRRGDHELDLLVWESGEAELVSGLVDGSIRQVHFDDIQNRTELGKLLAMLFEFSIVSIK